MPVEKKEEVIRELRNRVEKSNRIVSELENNGAFKELLSDFEEQKKRIDDNWHLVSNKEQLEEMRVTKLAVSSILNALDNYRHDFKVAQLELGKIENPDIVIGKDFDNG